MFNKINNITFTKYKDSLPIKSYCADFKNGVYEFNDAVIDTRIDLKQIGDETKVKLNFKLLSGAILNGGIGIEMIDNNWNKGNFLLMPAAAYNGNRFKCLEDRKYPPNFIPTDDLSLDMETTITDIPRLNKDGNSIIQLLSGDFSTPAICVYNPISNTGNIILFPSSTIVGYSGIRFIEEGNNARLEISFPGVRQGTKYVMTSTNQPSIDNGYFYRQGDSIEVNLSMYTFDCRSIQELYDYFDKVKNSVELDDSLPSELPFSEAKKLLVEKYNRQNWFDDEYYSVGILKNIFQEFQSGWVGGGINIYPLYMFGDEHTKERAVKTFEFIVNKIQCNSGFFYGMYGGGILYGDSFDGMDKKNILLLRKNADMLLFLIKLNNVLNRKDFDDSIIKCCDAFVRLWEKYGQWGQWIDLEKEEIFVPGSTSPVCAIAALTLAYERYKDAKYLEIASLAGEYYYENFLDKGYTCGGPGEILQCPDSESSFASLESFVTLYECTKDDKWLNMAKDAAMQASTWVMHYNFNFPNESEFGRLNMKTTGSVWASPQNKHSAPGICTLSGDSLFRLYRITKDEKYLNLGNKIARSLMQFIARDDRQIFAIDMDKCQGSGHINERCNTSDWEGLPMVGSIGDGSNWCEVSALLTLNDFPSVYVDKSNDTIAVFDHLDLVEKDSDYIILENNTKFDSTFTVFVENNQSLAQGFVNELETYVVKSGLQIKIKL